MSNVRRRMAATELARRGNASSAPRSTVASSVASRVAWQQGRPQGSRSSWQLAANGLCGTGREANAGVPFRGSGAGVTKPEGRRGSPVPQAGGQRKTVLAREGQVLCRVLLVSVAAVHAEGHEHRGNRSFARNGHLNWKRCGAPPPTTPNPSIEGTFQRPLRALWPAPHVKR